MKSPTPMSFLFVFLLFILSLAMSVYSEKRGFDKGMIAATTALEPHLCK